MPAQISQNLFRVAQVALSVTNEYYVTLCGVCVRRTVLATETSNRCQWNEVKISASMISFVSPIPIEIPAGAGRCRTILQCLAKHCRIVRIKTEPNDATVQRIFQNRSCRSEHHECEFQNGFCLTKYHTFRTNQETSTNRKMPTRRSIYIDFDWYFGRSVWCLYTGRPLFESNLLYYWTCIVRPLKIKMQFDKRIVYCFDVGRRASIFWHFIEANIAKSLTLHAVFVRKHKIKCEFPILIVFFIKQKWRFCKYWYIQFRLRAQSVSNSRLSGGDVFGGDVARITQQSHRHTPRWLNANPGDRCMVQWEAKPGFWWNLQSSVGMFEWKENGLVKALNWEDVFVSNSPANKISNDICMAHHQCIRVLLLLGIGTMEIFPEAGFDAGTVLEKLLHFNGVIHKIRMIHAKMEDEWKSEWLKTRCILCAYDNWQQRNQHLRVVRDASGRLVAAVQSVHPLRWVSNFQLVDLPRASRWFCPFPVPASLWTEPFCRVEFSIPSNVRRWNRLACDPFRWDIGPHRWHHSNYTARVWWESGDELQTVWPFPISRWTHFRRSVLHSISMVSPDFVAPDWKWNGKLAGESTRPWEWQHWLTDPNWNSIWRRAIQLYWLSTNCWQGFLGHDSSKCMCQHQAMHQLQLPSNVVFLPTRSFWFLFAITPNQHLFPVGDFLENETQN